MDRFRGCRCRRALVAACAPALLLATGGGAAAQPAGVTPGDAGLTLSLFGSIFLADNTGYGKTGAFDFKDGRWISDPVRGNVFECTVQMGVWPTTPGSEQGVMYEGRVEVYVDPTDGVVRIGNGNPTNWGYALRPISELSETFRPEEPPPGAPPEPPEPQEPPPGDDAISLDDIAFVAGGVLGILDGIVSSLPADPAGTVPPPPDEPPPSQPPEPPAPEEPPSQPPEPPAPEEPPSQPPEPPAPEAPAPEPPPSDQPPDQPPCTGLDCILQDHDPGAPVDPSIQPITIIDTEETQTGYQPP